MTGLTLAADIGGTYSRLAWASEGADAWHTERYENSRFRDFESIVLQSLETSGRSGQAIESMVLAVPGPVHEDPVTLTNIDWQLDRAALSRRFGIARLTIVNDFQAAALGAVRSPAERLIRLNPGVPDQGPVVVTGAGTGLGMAWLAETASERLPRATEGGHQDFAPQDPQQYALQQHLMTHFGHVSYERILSGPGLLDCYRFTAGAAAIATSPQEILALTCQGDRDAAATVKLFVRVLGAYAGNLALAFNPSGGIYLCGGLIVHLATHIDVQAFLTAFTAKGRMAKVVERIPVHLVDRQDTGLSGAMYIAKRINGAET